MFLIIESSGLNQTLNNTLTRLRKGNRIILSEYQLQMPNSLELIKARIERANYSVEKTLAYNRNLARKLSPYGLQPSAVFKALKQEYANYGGRE
jgi:hypothetical protein